MLSRGGLLEDPFAGKNRSKLPVTMDSAICSSAANFSSLQQAQVRHVVKEAPMDAQCAVTGVVIRPKIVGAMESGGYPPLISAASPPPAMDRQGLSRP